MVCREVVVFLAAVVAAGRVCAAPHIVVILADDMGWNDVGFHGSSQILTPNIDALGYQGLILNRHYTQPSCSPSRAALLAGRYPVHTGLQKPIEAGTRGALSLNFTLLPQHLTRLGYRSHLVGKWHLGCHRSEFLPTHRGGFQSHFGFWNGFIGYYDGIHMTNTLAGVDARRGEEGAWQEFAGRYITDVLTEEAVSIVEHHDSALGPLYLQLALSAPHTGNRGGELVVRDIVTNERQHGHIADLNRRLYAGMVRGVDDAVGAVLEALQARGMLRDSIVLFTSDNGAPTIDPLFGYNNSGSNWPLRGMKLSPHEGGVRTAAALWSPLVPGRRVSEQLIHMADWLPTFYTAAGGDVSELGPLDGVSQWEALRSSSHSGRSEMLVDLDPITGSEGFISWPWKLVRYSPDALPLHSFAGESGRGGEVPSYSVQEVLSSKAAKVLGLNLPASDVLALRAKATIDEKCPLVVNTGTSSIGDCSQHYCLFNLLSDPCETADVASTQPSVVATLRQSLDNYRRDMAPRSENIRDPRAHPGHWGNYWSPWDDDVKGGVAASLPLVSLILACIGLLTAVQYKCITFLIC